MIKHPKQVRNPALILAAVVGFLCCASQAYAYVPDNSGPKGAASDQTFSVGQLFDGFTKSLEDVVDIVTGEAEFGAAKPEEPKKDTGKKEDSKMIEAKRLDAVKDTATGQKAPAAGAAAPATPAPYKVYSAPIIPEEPAAQSAPMPTYRAPMPAAERAAPKVTPSSKLPLPALSEDIQTNLEDFIVNPPMGPKDFSSRSSSTRQSGLPTVQQGRQNQIPPTAALPKQFFPVFALGGAEDAPGQLLPLSSNYELESDHRRTSRVIIYIHDLQRNSAEGVATLMTLEGSSGSRTLLLAPQFSLDLDIVRFASFLPDNGRSVTRWTLEDPWQYGGESKTSPQQRGISSFTALDILLLVLSDRQRYPSLEQVVIAGHGMGADFVQRYAMVGQAPDILKKERILTRFVVANPSSFLYPTSNRPTGNGTRFGSPDTKECPKLNSYPFGMNELTAYGKREGANAIRMRYPERNVIYLVGDNIMADNYLDRSCEALAQGKDRTARSKLFARYMDQYFSETAAGSHIFAVVPKAGYDPVSLFGSACGMEALFGDGLCKVGR